MQTPNLQPVKTKKQMAEEYNVSDRTFRRWIITEKLQLPNRYLTPKEQLKVYDCFGQPSQRKDK